LVRVAVDPETGEVRILDYIAAQDVGRALNRGEVEGQIHGGIALGIGWALLEGMSYDERGQLLTATLMDYALPHSEDVPSITPLVVEVPCELGPFGARGGRRAAGSAGSRGHRQRHSRCHRQAPYGAAHDARAGARRHADLNVAAGRPFLS
jgi:hypothetical protein